MDRSDRSRRMVLSAVATGCLGVFSGCSSSDTTGSDTPPSEPSTTARESPTPTDTTTERATQTETATESSTQTTRENPDTVFVGPHGTDSNAGTRDDPVGTMREALDRVEPGETVHVLPGEYVDRIKPVEGGEPGDPITITGPADAVVRSDPDEWGLVRIEHSHVHITGLTLDGLENPDAPDDVESYSDAQLVQCRPPASTDEYLRDIVVAPHRIGNSRKSLVSLERTENAEVGPFEMIGPAGAKYVVGDADSHNGEVVYLGTAVSNLGSDWHPWTDLDRTSGVRVHHVNNERGYGHSELVNTKPGTHDVVVEYCTDGGGSHNTRGWPAASVNLQSFGATVRWCDLRDGRGNGVAIGSQRMRERRESKPEDELTEAERRGGFDNAVYGNRITGFRDQALSFPFDGQSAADQQYICGNEYDGKTADTPGESCSSAVPTGNGIGHTGGDSSRSQ